MAVMNVTETWLDEAGERYEQRYKLHVLSAIVDNMVRRPVTMEPPEGTVCFLDSGSRERPFSGRRTVGTWRGGHWVGVKLKDFTATHWTVWEGTPEAAKQPEPADAG